MTSNPVARFLRCVPLCVVIVSEALQLCLGASSEKLATVRNVLIRRGDSRDPESCSPYFTGVQSTNREEERKLPRIGCSSRVVGERSERRAVGRLAVLRSVHRSRGSTARFAAIKEDRASFSCIAAVDFPRSSLARVDSQGTGVFLMCQ